MIVFQEQHAASIIYDDNLSYTTNRDFHKDPLQFKSIHKGLIRVIVDMISSQQG